MTLYDFELLQGPILSKFRSISRLWEATTAKQMKVDLYCQWQNFSPLNVLLVVYWWCWYHRACLHYKASNKGGAVKMRYFLC